jgi:hypothetical protein
VGEALATIVAMLPACSLAWYGYIRKPASRAAFAAHFEPLYKFFSTNGISTSSTTSSSSPAFWFGRLFWKGGDIGTIDRFGPNGAALGGGAGSRAVQNPVGLSLHYALVMLLGLVGRNQLVYDASAMNAAEFSHPFDHARRAAGRRAGLSVCARRARIIALAATLFNLLLGVCSGPATTSGGAQWQCRKRVNCSGRLRLALGIDGIALMLIMLSVFLMPICIGASWRRSRSASANTWRLPADGNADDRRVRGAGPVPVLHLLRSRPDPDVPDHRHLGRAQPHLRSYKFFLYTLLGSVLMLIAMLWMVSEAGTTDIPTLMAYDFPPRRRPWLWLAFFASFAVKMPMWPVHTWLPDAHVQAPDRGLGHPGRRAAEDGRLRLHPLLAADVPGSLGAVHLADLRAVDGRGGLHQLVALVQHDMKKLIAYSSVAHMAIRHVGLFAFNRRVSKAR